MKTRHKLAAIVCAASSLGTLTLTCAPGAFASPISPAIDKEKSKVVENFTSYHGTKHQYIENVLKGINKPETGSQGNHDPDWKGFYTTDSKYAAAGYTPDEENPMSGKAGGVVKVSYTGKTKILALKDMPAGKIKGHLGLDPNKPLTEQIKDQEFINKYGEGADRVVLQMPFAEGSSEVEYINNWDNAKDLKVEPEVRFDQHGKRGQDAMYEYMALASCESAGKAKRSVSKTCLSNIKWERVRQKSEELIKKLKDDENVKKAVQERKEGVKPTSDDLQNLHKALIDHESFKELKSVHSNGVKAMDAANAALWGANVARVFSDSKSDGLEKATAALAAVPGLGQVMGVADGVTHHNTEEVVVQSVALAGFIAAQAIPVVGEIVDIGVLAYQFVEGVIDLSRQMMTSNARGIAEKRQVVDIKDANGLSGGWLTPQDSKIHLPPHYGTKTQRLAVSANGDHNLPITGFKTSINPKFFNINESGSFIVQNGLKVPMNCSEEASKTEAVCIPVHPIWLTDKNNAIIHVSYQTKSPEGSRIDNPRLEVWGQIMHTEEGPKTNTINLGYSVDQEMPCYSSIKFENGGDYVGRLAVNSKDGKVTHSKMSGMRDKDKVDLSAFNSGEVLTTEISPTGGGAPTPGPSIKYCSDGGIEASIKSWGTKDKAFLGFN
ncbi:hypothetical protein KEM60_01638 [Austwickia sp. TVS 96-490-7B]|uniref:toxin n=1 Tax=Austwickia sp. TVS 96-490-7B TaxID=2830843 RepID=UPI001C58C02B|nr:toxin [Austwickia sp. TVS 96-490-7B]MBW3085438.1 hypothetical protein [Austwickia sp. TVS 96-490-7B]